MSEQLREYIESSEHSRYRIAKETGVSQSALSRFNSRETTFGLDAVDALAAFLGLELRPIRPVRRAKKERPS